MPDSVARPELIIPDAPKHDAERVVECAFDGIADRYDAVFSDDRCMVEDKLLATRLEEFLPYAGPGPLLDVGCGSGLFLHLIPWFQHDEYTGIDISHRMLAKARDVFPRARFLPGSVEDMALVSGTFTGVVSLYSALSYVAAPLAALDEIHRVLTPGGKCFLMVYGPRWYDRYCERAGIAHLQTSPAAWTLWQAEQRMRLCRFKAIRITAFSLPVPTWALRWETPWCQRFPGAGRYLVIEGTKP